jgi:glycosyltransferase involved in cell wall biosynthesis
VSVSVVIPCFNRRDVIDQTLEAVFAQSQPPGEVIVVDDGSTDGSAGYLRERYGERIRLFEQANAGPGAARNLGWREATGTYIEFMDSDDVPALNKLETQVAALESAQADMAIGPWLRVHFDADGLAPDNLVFQQKGLPRTADPARALMCYWSLVPQACLFRRSLVERSGGFAEDIYAGEDQVFFVRCLVAGARVVHTPGTLLLYRASEVATKITAPGPGDLRRHLHWSRALLSMRESLRQARPGTEPLDWLGYRRRLWASCHDLSRFEAEEPRAQIRALHALLGRERVPRGYVYLSKLQRYLGGVQVRTVGGRAHRSFRIGPLSPAQREWVERGGWRWAR